MVRVRRRVEAMECVNPVEANSADTLDWWPTITTQPSLRAGRHAPFAPSWHSSQVELFLRVGPDSYELGQVGPDLVVFREAAQLPPCDAEVVVIIDGRDHRRLVSLNEGSVSHSRMCKITANV